MNDVELERRLREFAAPKASESARERARHRALLALGGGVADTAATGRGLSWAWAAGAAVLLVLLAVTFHRRHAPGEDFASDRKILEQMQVLFPRQVDAIVEVNGKVELNIAQSPVVGADQPVVVLFRQGPETIRVLSYSGHRVCLQLGGGAENCFEILTTPTGEVILEGRDRAWLASEHPKIAGYSVRAQSLGVSL